MYSHVFRMLNEYDVMIDAILLKPNMILPGLDADVATPDEVARYTVRTMMRSIPPAVPGIHFLSGGMSEEESTLNLQVRGSCACSVFLAFMRSTRCAMQCVTCAQAHAASAVLCSATCAVQCVTCVRVARKQCCKDVLCHRLT